MSHLHPDIIANMAQSARDGGIWLKDVPVGSAVRVQTKNTLYTFTKTGEKAFTVRGHSRLGPDDVKAYIAGSTWGGSLLKVGFVGVGMRLEFGTDEHRYILTTPIESAEVSHV